MQLVSLNINPVPSGATAGALPGYDGAKLRFARWQPTRGPARGTVCIFPGRGEYIEKFFETVADLRRRGFAVAVLDWRGQGGSARLLSNSRKGHVISFNEYDRDLASFMMTVVLPTCPPPYIALAHSMGGNILLRHARRANSWFSRMVLCVPMIRIHDDRMGASRALARTYAEIAGSIGLATTYVRGGDDLAEEIAPFEGNPLTSDYVRWARNKAVVDAAPELGLGAPTVGWLKAALRSCRLLAEPGYPKTVKVPILMFAAGDDKIVDPRAIEDFGADLKIGGTILMPGARHEILQERDPVRQRFWAAFDAYMGVDIV